MTGRRRERRNPSAVVIDICVTDWGEPESDQSWFFIDCGWLWDKREGRFNVDRNNGCDRMLIKLHDILIASLKRINATHVVFNFSAENARDVIRRSVNSASNQKRNKFI